MPANNAAFVGSIPENYDLYLGPVLFEPYAADLAARLQVPENASVLELACGTGIVTRRLRDRLNPDAKLVATDLNEAMLDYARAKFAPESPVQWQQADATDLPFADQSFDAVVCQFGFMFFPDKDKALREAFRVLRPGGTLLFNVWDAIEHNDLARTARDVITKFFADNPPDFYDVPFSFYDPEAIRTHLSAAGFEDIELTMLPFPSKSVSAHAAVQGLIHGNPIIAAIKERDETLIPEIEAVLEAKIADQYGVAPVEAKMQALICEAKRR